MYFNESIWDAVHAPRVHHQLLPMELIYEEGLPDDIVSGLQAIGHKTVKGTADLGFASLTAIGREGKKLTPVYDPRRLGSTLVF